MKKLIRVLLTIAIAVIYSLPLTADGYIASLTGTTSTYNDELAIVDFSVSGNNIDNVRGNVNYPADKVTVFSVEKSGSRSNWNVSFDTNEKGRIYFTAQAGSSTSSSTTLFTVTFVVHSDMNAVNITTSDIVSNMTVNEQVVTNQDAIDAAREKENMCKANGGCIDEVIIPSPVYENRHVNKDQSFTNGSHTISVSKRVLDSAYLKSAVFKDATMTPVFNKLTTTYKVEVDNKQKELTYDFVLENPECQIDVSDEINNQIIVTVTAEDGDVNSYVFNIVRTSNFNPNKQNETVDPANTNALELSTSLKLMLAALAVVSIGFIVVGGYYIYIGAREP